MQGSTRPVRLAHNAQGLTDGAGLLLIRQLWDRLQLGARIDQRTRAVDRRYRSSLFIEVWLVLLLYGGGVLTDLPRLAARGVARLFGWRTVPDPTTFGRWLRRAGTLLPGLLDELLWYLVRARWGVAGRPTALTLILDSTVVLRYGLQQAGAERGYNPTKPGRPSHHPLFAFTDQGDCLGVRWRGGAAHTAAGAADWLGILVGRLRQLGITDLTVRLDKGFCSKAMVERLHDLHVSFLLKVPNQAWVRRALGPYRASEKDPTLWTAHGELYGARLCAVQQRLPRCAPADVQQALALDDYLVPDHGTAHVLTNLPGIHALSAWRRYNDGAVVEQRIKECYQLGFGRTAIDDRDGNATLAALGALAYQVLHVVRTTALTGPWRAAQPATLRAWLFRLPAKCITHARTAYVRLLRSEPLRPALLRALRLLGNLPPPRTHRLALG